MEGELEIEGEPEMKSQSQKRGEKPETDGEQRI